MEPLITVIIPIYNVEKYLDNCIQSVIEQTYSNLEIILVNDGSTDNSLLICEKYKKKDKRIVIISQKNLGMSVARNIGIQNAHGEYISFVDSDDYINEKMIEKLYVVLRETEADLSICNFNYVNEYNESILETVASPMKNRVYNNKEIIDMLFGNIVCSYVVVWNKLYKKQLWNNLRFPKGYIHEDEAVIHRIYDNCKKVVTITDQLYFYRKVPGSIMNSGRNEKRLDSYTALADRIVFLENRISEKNMKRLLCQYWDMFLNDYFYFKEKNKSSVYLKRMKKSLYKVFPILVKYKICSFKENISITIFLLNPTIYKAIFRSIN